MKYIKTFEANQNRPKVGDYVICTDFSDIKEGTREFLLNNIGRIIKVNYKVDNPYNVMYDNLPINSDFYNEGGKSTRYFKREEILHFAENKEDLEIKINTDKYNL